MEIIKKIITQTSWQIVGKIATSLSTLIVLGLIARNYGTEGVGVYTLILTVLAILYLIADFGLNAEIVPKLLKDKNYQWNKLLGLRLIISLMAVFIGLIVAFAYPSPKLVFRIGLLFGVISVFFSAIFISANAIFQAKIKYQYSVLTTTLGSLVFFLIAILLLKFNIPIPYLILANVFGWVVTGILSIFLASKYFSIKPQIDWSFSKKLIINSWPISLTLFLNILYFRIDVFLLTYFKGLSDVGIYNLAYQIFQNALVIPTFLMNSYYPLMLKTYFFNKVEFLHQLSRASLLLLIISILGLAFVFISSNSLISVLTGGGFSGSATSLKILSLSFPAYFLSALFMWVYITLKKYKALLLIYLTGLIVNIILNLLFIPQYSYLAASLITGISEYLILALLLSIFSLNKNKWI